MLKVSSIRMSAKLWITALLAFSFCQLCHIIAVDIEAMILACRKGVDCRSVETPGLLTDPFFNDVLHFLVTGADCQSDQFECKNKRCINRNHVCDGDNDCNDRSDEDICVPGVCNNPALFKCKDGRSCISVLKVCDGSNHCNDGSDEVDCGSGSCRHPDLFKCSNGLCIAKKFVCDGAQDCNDTSDEQGCDTGILSIRGVKASILRGISWLKSQRNNRWDWEENTDRAIIALYLSGGATFNGTNEEEELVAKQLELRIALALLRNESVPLSPNQLALFINALLVTCHNPRNFYGFDFVNALKSMVGSQVNNTQPLVYSALCNANETVSPNAVRYLLGLLEIESEYLFWTDIQAMAAIALSCITSQKQYAHVAPNVTEAVKEFKLQQRADGSFGNVYTTALVIQALLATGNENEKDWDLEGSINFLLSKQSTTDSSFGDFLATYLILPILRSKTLADIAQVKCNNLRRQPRDRNSVFDFGTHLGPFVYVKYSLYIGDDVKVIHPLSLRVPSNITAVDVMDLAVRADPKYKYESKRSSHGLYIYAINGIANDAESGMFWLLYLGGISSTEGTLRMESPDKIFIRGNEHLIMWYKTARTADFYP